MMRLRTVFVLAFGMIWGLTSAPAHANHELTSGRDEALKVCDAMSSPGFRRNCREVVAQAQNFSTNAVQACAALTMDTRQIDCLKVISDRFYSDGEVASCRKETFDPHVIECLGSLGRPAQGDLDTRLRIRDAIRSLERGYPALAEQQLRRLLDSLGGDPDHR